jgi:hypothetical protein
MLRLIGDFSQKSKNRDIHAFPLEHFRRKSVGVRYFRFHAELRKTDGCPVLSPVSRLIGRPKRESVYKTPSVVQKNLLMVVL